MKEPKSKLPFDLSDMGEYGFHITTQKSDGGELITDALCNENDVKYLHQAANNFPKAIELLNRLKTAYSTNCKESNDDGSISGWGLLVEVEEFLKEIDNG